MTVDRQIIAFGSRKLLDGPERPVAIEYLLAQANTDRPAVGLIGTASGDSPSFTDTFYSKLASFNCSPSDLPLFGRTPDVREFIFAQDIIFVGGGNTKSMLAVWREWGVDQALKEAWARGIIMSGSSAGAICWFDEGVTDSYAGQLQPLAAMGLLPGSCCPHFDADTVRRPRYRALLENGRMNPGIGIDDAAAAHFLGTELHQCISDTPGSGVYELTATGEGVSENPLPVVLL